MFESIKPSYAGPFCPIREITHIHYARSIDIYAHAHYFESHHAPLECRTSPSRKGHDKT